MNQTAVKFGFPGSLVAETSRWLVLVRPEQPTLGSLVLVCKDKSQAFGTISSEAFLDLQHAVRSIESCLCHAVQYNKLNYLMLMMNDPDVHFHVIPRYEGIRQHAGLMITDVGWPGQPTLNVATRLDEAGIHTVVNLVRAGWPDQTAK